MTINIIYSENPSANDLKLLSEGIALEANLKRGLPKGKSFCFFCKDNNENILGGIHGWVIYGCLHIDELWMDSNHRNQGLASKLRPIQAANATLPCLKNISAGV